MAIFTLCRDDKDIYVTFSEETKSHSWSASHRPAIVVTWYSVHSDERVAHEVTQLDEARKYWRELIEDSWK